MTSERDHDFGAEPQTEVLPAKVGPGSQRITIGGARLELNTLKPEVLAASLRLGRAALNKAILDRLVDGIHANPELTLSPAPLFVVKFGIHGRGGKKRIFTPKGYANHTAGHEKIEEIKEPYHPYWQAIIDGGFRPEVRRNLAPNDEIWLLLHRIKAGYVIRIGRQSYEV